MNLTPNEAALIDRLTKSEFEPGALWAECVCDHEMPFDRDGLGGVVASLTKKGLATTYEHEPGQAWIELTDAGWAAHREWLIENIPPEHEYPEDIDEEAGWERYYERKSFYSDPPESF